MQCGNLETACSIVHINEADHLRRTHHALGDLKTTGWAYPFGGGGSGVTISDNGVVEALLAITLRICTGVPPAKASLA